MRGSGSSAADRAYVDSDGQQRKERTMIRKALCAAACLAALSLVAPSSFGEPTNERSHAAASNAGAAMCGVPVRTHELQELGGIAQQQTASTQLSATGAQTTNPVPFPATEHQKQVLRGSERMDIVNAAPTETTMTVNGMPATKHQMELLRSTRVAARGMTGSERNIGGC
jgi:hypothetical protein